MVKPVLQGSIAPTVQSGEIPGDSPEVIQKYLEALNTNKKRWTKESPQQILKMLLHTRENLMACMDEWAEADMNNRGRAAGSWDSVVSYLAGPDFAMVLLGQYINTFEALSHSKLPNHKNRFKLNIFGQTTVQTFPLGAKEKALYLGQKGELWFKPGLMKKHIAETQAHLYTKNSHHGKISLVLGAGNYSIITFSDTLHKLLNDREVVIIKMHPVTEYAGKFFKKIFSEFINGGFLRLSYGGIETGQLIKTNELVDSVHITGSDKSFEAIVFGSGKELQMNKMKRNYKLNKIVSGELGNVGPIIVVPGLWTKEDINYQAENIISTLAFNTGFNCLASRVIVQQAEWKDRHELNSAVEAVFKSLQRDKCYYPGSIERMKEILEYYPDAKVVGDFEDGKAPWIFVPGLDANNAQELAFKNEIFGPFLSETAISANSTLEFIDKAVEFCNNTLWGTLNATILVHPHTLRDLKVRYAIDRAIKNLNYGMVCVNNTAAQGYLAGSLAWGGAPGSPLNNIQSGNLFVHNPFMYEGIQKSVLRGPFRSLAKPPFPSNPKTPKIVERLHEFSKNPTWSNLFKAVFASV